MRPDVEQGTHEMDAGSTSTIEFISTDDYGEWDEVEFQVQYEF